MTVKQPIIARLFILALTTATMMGCATQTVRVSEVTPRYLKPGQKSSTDLAYDRGESRFNGGLVSGSVRGASGEEFFIRWNSTLVRSVKFEYRQVNAPGKTSEQSATVEGTTWRAFTIAGKDFQTGGPVSAWRVSLLDQSGHSLATKQSVMW